ncbi:hypothetical protein OPV22_032458 [Ensete ventricosum]|uniref:Uncharacterized protein n=1 Tax=Ensete ventricosum TaxID=4639 RepID=A0AAV8PVG6_ENSVE|nr:hypothetical protein OPV22_032458 [Ensete ventricosum]
MSNIAIRPSINKSKSLASSETLAFECSTLAFPKQGSTATTGAREDKVYHGLGTCSKEAVDPNLALVETLSIVERQFIPLGLHEEGNGDLVNVYMETHSKWERVMSFTKKLDALGQLQYSQLQGLQSCSRFGCENLSGGFMSRSK